MPTREATLLPLKPPAFRQFMVTKDEIKASDTTYRANEQLRFKVGPNRKYVIRGWLFFTVGATEDVKYTLSYPANPLTVHVQHWYRPAGGVFASSTSKAATAVGLAVLGGAGVSVSHVNAFVETSQGGEIAITWAQNTSGATATILRAGSYLEVLEVPAGPDSSAREIPWAFYGKKKTQSKFSDAVLADDDELKFPVQGGKRYAIRGIIQYWTGATPDFKCDFNGPASPGIYQAEIYDRTPGSTWGSVAHTAFGTLITLTASNTAWGFVSISAILETTVGGVVSFRWAQNTSDAALTYVLAGSYLEVLPLP